MLTEKDKGCVTVQEMWILMEYFFLKSKRMGVWSWFSDENASWDAHIPHFNVWVHVPVPPLISTSCQCTTCETAGHGSSNWALAIHVEE